jgi:hypothetical protein
VQISHIILPPALCYLLSAICYLLFRRTSPNDAGGASHDSADNASGYSTNSDNVARSNTDIRSNSPNNNQGSNRPVDPQKPQRGNPLLQVVE